MKTFERLQKMSDEEMDIRLAPLDNVKSVNIYGQNGEFTIGVPREVAQDWMDGQEFVGGLLLADKKQFDSISSSEEKTRQVGQVEVDGLIPIDVALENQQRAEFLSRMNDVKNKLWPLFDMLKAPFVPLEEGGYDHYCSMLQAVNGQLYLFSKYMALRGTNSDMDERYHEPSEQ